MPSIVDSLARAADAHPAHAAAPPSVAPSGTRAQPQATGSAAMVRRCILVAEMVSNARGCVFLTPNQYMQSSTKSNMVLENTKV